MKNTYDFNAIDSCRTGLFRIFQVLLLSLTISPFANAGVPAPPNNTNCVDPDGWGGNGL